MGDVPGIVAAVSGAILGMSAIIWKLFSIADAIQDTITDVRTLKKQVGELKRKVDELRQTVQRGERNRDRRARDYDR